MTISIVVALKPSTVQLSVVSVAEATMQVELSLNVMLVSTRSVSKPDPVKVITSPPSWFKSTAGLTASTTRATSIVATLVSSGIKPL